MRDDDRPEQKDEAVPATDRSDEVASVVAATRIGALRKATLPLRKATLPLRKATLPLRRGTARRGTVRDSLGRSRPVPRTVSVGLLCALGLLAFTQGRIETGNHPVEREPAAAIAALAQRARAEQPASRSEKRAEVSAEATTDAPAAQPTPTPPAPPAPPVDPGPVAGLSGVQMDNAKAIVRTGHDMGMPRRALIIGVATAMQESNLLNLANDALPESLGHPHQGTGWDHDSVGLFQQRTSSGWGPVDRLMDPAYATAQFFNALRRVPGWEGMALTDAAQAVQVSAFPGYYARHEGAATEVVDAIIPPNR